ncbi:MAG: hypothetical protein M1420_03310 [Actinobacteria bacterium]|nr:hypothetical protein [Actinomycetota bacterium]
MTSTGIQIFHIGTSTVAGMARVVYNGWQVSVTAKTLDQGAQGLIESGKGLSTKGMDSRLQQITKPWCMAIQNTRKERI